MKYRKKPVVIEAYHFTGSFRDNEIPNWLCACMNGESEPAIYYQGGDNPYFTIETLEGKMRASVGDYIIKGVKGEIYPCKPDIFQQTYEAVEDIS